MNFDIKEMVDLSGKKAHIYSVILEGEDKTLLEEFFDSNSLYEDELEEILYKIISLGKDTGCRRQFFKMNEGKPGDGVARLLIPKGRLRLDCLYFDNTAVFFGSGGYKPETIHAYQEDEVLNSKATQMIEIARRINKAIVDRDITIGEDGSLTINNWDYE